MLQSMLHVLSMHLVLRCCAAGQEEEYQFDAELDVDYDRLSYEVCAVTACAAGAVSICQQPRLL
jgi:hypothetical protein